MRIDEETLTSSLRRLAALEQPDDTLASTLKRTLEACVDLFQVTGGGIMIADDQDVLRYVTATDEAGRVLETAEIETGRGPCTEAFVTGEVVTTDDVTAETSRWPALAAALADQPVRAVLGLPVRLGGVPVGTLDVYLDRPHDWDESEQAALSRYSDVVESTLTASLHAHAAGELAGQLQYALDYRVVIERAVGYLMATEATDAVAAFNLLRNHARSRRTKIGEVAGHLLDSGRLPD